MLGVSVHVDTVEVGVRLILFRYFHVCVSHFLRIFCSHGRRWGILDKLFVPGESDDESETSDSAESISDGELFDEIVSHRRRLDVIVRHFV